MRSASDPATHRAGNPQNQANHEQDSTDGVQDADAKEIPEQQQDQTKDDQGTLLILTRTERVPPLVPVLALRETLWSAQGVSRDSRSANSRAD
jgi:hypothetical protein